MILGQDEVRGRIERERVVRVATIDECGRAHLVPVVFVVDGDIFYSPTDEGPRLSKRLRNLDYDQRVTILADFYDEDWPKVWWVRMRGTGRVVGESPERTHAIGLLERKYPQFAGTPSAEAGGPVLAVDIKDWSGWAYR
jgi:PPOX class probable F420-dependent enzyme